VPYDAVEAAKRGERVAFLAKMVGEAFPPDSKPDSPGVSHTDAKPEIWTKSTEFQKDLQNLVDRTQALAVAAQSGDAAKLKIAVGDAGKACKDCHDEFRVKH
jgi:cytochrome c556